MQGTDSSCPVAQKREGNSDCIDCDLIIKVVPIVAVAFAITVVLCNVVVLICWTRHKNKQSDSSKPRSQTCVVINDLYKLVLVCTLII